MGRVAVFEGLVTDEADNIVKVAYVGNAAHYVVDDGGFLRHIPAEKVDRQVMQAMQAGVLENKDAVMEGMLQYLGKDDLFTKAAIETAIGQMESNIVQLMEIGLPEETRSWLGMMGFKVVIDLHGDVIDLNMPGTIDLDE